MARLRGYDLASVGDGAGETLTLALHWEALSETLASYKVFVHVVGAGEALVAQSDQEPGAGRQPTTGWRVGDIIVDEHRIVLPEDAAGTLQVYVGMYDPATGERLAATVVGEARGDGRIPLVALEADALP